MNRLPLFLMALMTIGLLSPPLGAQDHDLVAQWNQSSDLEAHSSVLDMRAGLAVQDVRLSEALVSLDEHRDVTISFSPDAIPLDRTVSCDCAESSIGSTLDRLLEGTDLRYSIMGSFIVIEEASHATQVSTTSAANSGLGLQLSSLSGAPLALRTTRRTPRTPVTGTVTGRVVEQGSGRPLAGAQVSIPAHELGTLASSDGSFTLENVPAGEVTVEVQILGFATNRRTVNVASGETVDVTFQMRQQALALDEVVVTGTAGGTQRRALGNVVERIDMAALQELSPATHTEQLLGSRMPGVVLMPSAGQVGADAGAIRIRGTSSTALSNDPIVYVDGIRINTDRTGQGRDGASSRLNDIHPSEIESMEVIKGPAAATLYGTEASNGVIQIITKRGAEGAPTFDASVEMGANFLQDPAGKIGETFWRNPDTGELISHNLYETWEQRHGEPMFQYGGIQRYNVAVRGGTETLRYSASVSRDESEGILDYNWQDRWSARGSLSLTPRDDLDINVTGGFNTSEGRRGGNFWMYTIWGQPATAADVGGRDDPRGGFYVRPLDVHGEGQIIMNNVDRTQWSAEIRYEPFSFFTNRLVAGTDVTHENRSTTTLRDPQGAGGLFGAAGLGQKIINTDEVRVTTVDYAGTFSFQPTESLGTDTSFGLQYYNREFWNRFARGDDMPTRATRTIGTAAITQSSEDLVENTTVGGYVQQQFDWNQRVFLTGAVRMDDNSAFGADFDAAIYPKLSATWVMHEEGFWTFDRVNQFRLRGAFGAAGQQPDIFDAARLYSSVTGPADQPMLTPQAVGNPELQPERGEELELGFDAGFMDDRVTLNMTRYWRTTRDAIVARGLAPSGGFPGTQLVNVGEVANWGLETQVDIQVLQENPVIWDLGIAFATINNEVRDLGDVEQLSVRRTRFHREGYPLASIFDYRILSADFVEGTSGPVTNIMCDGGTGPDGLRMGGSPVPCDEAPLLFYGPSEPTWQANLTSNFQLFDNWGIFASVDARGGHIHADDGVNARHTSFANTRLSWEQDDPIFMAHRQIRRQPLGFYDAGFARLREVALSYSIPQEFAGRLGAQRGSIRFAMRNVALLWQEQEFTNFGPRVVDPEQGLPFEEFGGESALEPPPLSHAVVTVRFTF